MSIFEDNPLLLISTIIVFFFTIYIVYTMVKEIKLNKLLKAKQNQMRITSNSKSFTKRIRILTAAAITPLLLLTLTLAFNVNTPSAPEGRLADIRSGNDILRIYNEYQELTGRYDYTNDFIEGDAPAMEDSTDDEQGSDDYSETNVQVQGVDEMDNVITDGKYIYQMRNNQVLITLAYTQSQESNALSNYKIINYVDDDTLCPTGMYVTGLYVDDDYLIVIGSEYEYRCEINPDDETQTVEPGYYDYWYGYNNNVKAYVYDKNDDFNLTGEYDFSGNLIGTRKIDDNIFIITSSYIPLYREDINVDDYLPYYGINDQEQVNASYSDISYVEGISPNSYTTFYALDLENENVDMEVILGDSGYNLYVSHNNIYLVGNLYYYQPMVDGLDAIDVSYETRTAIQKISINDADLEYVTTKTVLGYTLNQFSMDEKDGYLRLATTSGWWGENINNRLFVLDENLDEVSRIENLGKPGETIHSVRFVGDYGYVVTFQRTDPFYVINLSDPENPFKEGELEIPGFSTYLQPLNDNFMLGIGFGDSEGGTNGIKISVYDISDKTNPVEFDGVTFDYEDFGWSWSSATYNHKDLLVSLSKGIIALPFSTYDYSPEDGYSFNSGILVYKFDEIDGLSKSGFITHDQNTDEEVYVYKIKFIDQYFYTISDKYIKASLISQPESILNSVSLPEYQYSSNQDDVTSD